MKTFLYYLKYIGLNTRMSTILQHTSQQVKYNRASWQELTLKNRRKKSRAKQSIGCVYTLLKEKMGGNPVNCLISKVSNNCLTCFICSLRPIERFLYNQTNKLEQAQGLKWMRCQILREVIQNKNLQFSSW